MSDVKGTIRTEAHRLYPLRCGDQIDQDRHIFIQGSLFGYSLKVAELEDEVKALKKQVSELNNKLFNERIGTK